MEKKMFPLRPGFLKRDTIVFASLHNAQVIEKPEMVENVITIYNTTWWTTNWASSCSGLCEMSPEISSQSFPQLIDSNHLHPSSHLLTHRVFLVFYLHFAK